VAADRPGLLTLGGGAGRFHPIAMTGVVDRHPSQENRPMNFRGAWLLAQANDQGGGAPVWIVLLIQLAILVLVIAGAWRMYEKAGQPGWAVLIPFYNAYVLLKIVNRPGWWLILFLIPFVNIVFSIVVMADLARSFGKGVGFTFGLIFLGFIFIPILGFGDAQYQPSKVVGSPARDWAA
jgi:hypothetical protein